LPDIPLKNFFPFLFPCGENAKGKRGWRGVRGEVKKGNAQRARG